MSLPEIVSREEWLEARIALLAEEKTLTRQRDALSAKRRQLPMVRVEKEYVLEGPDGKVTLAELFGGHRQLVVQHIMFGPDWDAGCPRCTASTSEFSPTLLGRINEADTAFAMVCRAPIEKVRAYSEGRGWALPWYSSYGSAFNYDFRVTIDSSVPQLEYNYRPEPGILGDAGGSTELPGASCFLREGDEIFHTYSAYARGLDHTEMRYAFLDLTVLGRQDS
ncbi:DUF899 domain-containing protein [Actinospica sp.]|jgi:predicted dithiol-disulfide oxidoreductase (DUF899 family)|uniref:DUF899 domain-containing protein n=1 Tax=Actinospica sp. TaxID=1872142 RepID=UPI002CB1408E|nr:DUF899 domain-containing protein [Actinospica sp.]HWG24115.1 DUF899 domain-containing protein [Actinospica sp.]